MSQNQLFDQIQTSQSSKAINSLANDKLFLSQVKSFLQQLSNFQYLILSSFKRKTSYGNQFPFAHV